MADETISYQVYKSRDQIRNQIITLLKQYMELENVDLTKSSFLSFLVEILSTNTSNLLFYQISAYREFFLTQAQLPSSIYNLSAFLGYNPSDATPSEVNVLFTVPKSFDEDTTFTIPEDWIVTAEGGIKFSTYYTTTVSITDNQSTITVIVKEGNSTYNLPVTIESDQFLFVLPFQQTVSSEQEFQVSEDLQQYQFVSIDVPFDGQISSQKVEVRPEGGTSYELYSEVASLFLMDDTTKGYVARRTDTGLSLQFGNGLIGYQPEAGSTVRVTLSLTDGSDGNVIAGSINSSDRIYNTTLAGVTEVVQYEITNTSPASGGDDEESIEQIRQNAITNLTALERIITENDFVNANTIIDDSPIGQNSLPVLKRSDLKINEIALFSILLFSTDLVPTRNVYETFSSTTIPRNTIITKDSVQYYTVFDMEIDTLNSVAEYTYVLYEIEKIPTLVTSYGSEYDLYADKLTVTKSGTSATYKLDIKSSESDYLTTSCEMEISDTGATYNMTHDGTAFTLVFSDYTAIPEGNLTYFFTITHPSLGPIAQYSSQFILRLSLDDFELSNVVVDSTAYTVYDIPVIRKSYYDSIVKRDFELQVLQTMLTTMTFKDYRMLTDFINFKFANTTGSLENMQLNDVDIAAVKDILSDPPTSGTVGDRYIVLNGTGDWEGYDDYVAVLSDSTALTWSFVAPKSDQIVYVTNKAYKYLYSETGWVIPNYEIPLQISLDVFVSSTYSGTLGDLTQAIRNALLEEFDDRFGINVDIYRSEIIDVVQEVDGVEHCRLIKPESSVFFNFDIDDFTQTELLQYSPEYVYFTEDSISIRIF
ncbi:MAG: DUF2793 domain-containing protein [Candidatus Thorarchaeota archaeon]